MSGNSNHVINSYTLASRMREARRRYRITATEQALFYELVAICNEEGWISIFHATNFELCYALGVEEKTLQRVRKNLIDAGLIYYMPGKSKRDVSKYSFIGEIVEISTDKIDKDEEEKEVTTGATPDTSPVVTTGATPDTSTVTIPVDVRNNNILYINKTKQNNNAPFGVNNFSPIEFISIDDFANKTLGNDMRVEENCIALGCEIRTLSDLLKKFVEEQKAKGNSYNTDKAYRSHFVNWGRKNVSTVKKQFEHEKDVI